MITRRNDDEVIFTLAVAGAVRLRRDTEHTDHAKRKINPPLHIFLLLLELSESYCSEVLNRGVWAELEITDWSHKMVIAFPDKKMKSLSGFLVI